MGYNALLALAENNCKFYFVLSPCKSILLDVVLKALQKPTAMNKIQIFAASSINVLQSAINEWLADNKDAHIIETNIASKLFRPEI